ncbi:MAG: membrane protein insertase YidC [Bryobacteraceae bacterium]
MSTNIGSVPPKPPSFEKRLPLALALMMLVLLASQYFFKPAPGPKPATPVNKEQAAKVTDKPAAASTAAPPIMAAGPGGAHVSASSETDTTIDTALYRVVFSNRGAVIKSWVLKRYRDESGKPLELINQAATDVLRPFAIELKDQKLTVDPNTVLYKSKVSGDDTGVDFDFADSSSTIHKSFSFGKDSYLAEVKSQILVNNNPIPHFLLWRGGFGDLRVSNAAASQHTVRYDPGAGKLVTKTTKDAKDGPVTDSGNYTFAGLEDTFFAAVALPNGSSSLEVRTFSDSVKLPKEDKPSSFIGAGLSTGAQNDFSLFVGPKDIDILQKVNPKLGQIVDWGFFGILAHPLFTSLNWVHDHWTGNYGWAIILVTLIINLALFPLRLSSLKSARKMQKLQPQIQAINAKYKNISLRDPKKAEQNQEVMELYKREGVNPVGGCVPMLIQLPFFYAFYRVLNIAIELRHAPWLWVPDLSSAETLPIHLLPLILIGTQFLTQRMTPAAGVDPNQQKMMLMMPLFFGFMFYHASAGLVLYWLTGNLVGIAQQLLINRLMPAPAAPVAPTAKAPMKKITRK